MTREIRECLPPDRAPHPPRSTSPAGTIDTHVHVFEGRYPLSHNRGYTPPESTLDNLRNLHSTLGVDRVVFTQPSVYGTDNSAILDAMAELNSETPNRARAVIATGLDASDSDLESLNAAGVRGVRLNTDNVGGMPMEIDEIPRLCDRISPLGWQIEFLFPGADIVDLMPVFKSVTVPMSIGHFGYQPAVDGTATPGFRALIDLVEAGNTWVKISGANRVSATDLPPYDDVEPLAHALLKAAPDRIMWGTDWPHPNRYEANPNDGDMMDSFNGWFSDDDLRSKVLVDTPNLFYRF